MTIIAWNGKYLAADSRRTRRKTEIFDNADKIDLSFNDFFFDGESILAIASAGNVKTTSYLKWVIKNKPRSLYFLNQEYTSGNLKKFKRGSLFIVTTKSAWILTILSSSSCRLTECHTSDNIAIGSGGKIATYLMNVFNLLPQDAVKATLLYQRSCGGPVRYVNCRSTIANKSLVIKTFDYSNLGDLKGIVFTKIVKKCNQFLDKNA